MIGGWPTSGQQPLGIQVPSEIAYSDHADADERFISWGYNLSPRDKTVRITSTSTWLSTADQVVQAWLRD